MLTVFSDMTQSEIQISAAFVQECAEVSQGLETLGAYSLHDLVMLDRTLTPTPTLTLTLTVAVILALTLARTLHQACAPATAFCGLTARRWAARRAEPKP